MLILNDLIGIVNIPISINIFKFPFSTNIFHTNSTVINPINSSTINNTLRRVKDFLVVKNLDPGLKKIEIIIKNAVDSNSNSINTSVRINNPNSNSDPISNPNSDPNIPITNPTPNNNINPITNPTPNNNINPNANPVDVDSNSDMSDDEQIPESEETRELSIRYVEARHRTRELREELAARREIAAIFEELDECEDEEREAELEEELDKRIKDYRWNRD
jgi:hypothetical protein